MARKGGREGRGEEGHNILDHFYPPKKLGHFFPPFFPSIVGGRLTVPGHKRIMREWESEGGAFSSQFRLLLFPPLSAPKMVVCLGAALLAVGGRGREWRRR